MQRVVTNQHEDVSIFQPIRCKTQLTNYTSFTALIDRSSLRGEFFIGKKEGDCTTLQCKQAFSQPINYNERHILAIFVRLYIDLEDVSTFLFVFICCYFSCAKNYG